MQRQWWQLRTKGFSELSTRASAVACEILDYFVKHPMAADSVEGIARWRLMQRTIENTVTETNSALDWLVRRGFLLRQATVSSGRIFHLNPDKRDAAKRLVRAASRRTARNES